ncbi:hypothetical protein HCCG_01057 [Helicobacter cinaedi CCUG 18818 = ATCC BAA-847]|uniref:Uncharacterized protein n=1 Tax=Helicobacter cinaedi CCUG 18818 = ATCC BAA-847 TaxID=537971 RepID=A0ABN0BAE9_9HELI|nr:hypothetical protein HCCG_01057 [Helicobacter cinaedi CCUG 18818 = ATCC BAA-847]
MRFFSIFALRVVPSSKVIVLSLCDYHFAIIIQDIKEILLSEEI